MANTTSFLLRISSETMDAVKALAADQSRSANAQIEFILRQALNAAGRLKKDEPPKPKPSKEAE